MARRAMLPIHRAVPRPLPLHHRQAVQITIGRVVGEQMSVRQVDVLQSHAHMLLPLDTAA